MQSFAHRPEIVRRLASHPPKHAASENPAHQLQRSIGNLAVQRMYAKPSHENGAGGDPSGAQAQQANGTGTGSGVTAPATVPATDISTTDTSPPAFTPNAHFDWWVKWNTDGRNGWIVQRFEPRIMGKDSHGADISEQTLGAPGPYYEAWRVDDKGKITGGPHTPANSDGWRLNTVPALGGPLSMSFGGSVYWTSQDPAQSGFTYGGVGWAHGLLSSTSTPPGLSPIKLVRAAYGVWDKHGTPTFNFAFGV